MREFIRHPTDIHIEISIDTAAMAAHEQMQMQMQMQNISYGGRQINSSAPWPTDAISHCASLA